VLAWLPGHAHIGHGYEAGILIVLQPDSERHVNPIGSQCNFVLNKRAEELADIVCSIVANARAVAAVIGVKIACSPDDILSATPGKVMLEIKI